MTCPSAAVGAHTNIKQSTQSPWSHAKPISSMKMDLSREMSLEKHHRGISPPERSNLHYISRFGEELKAPTTIQEKLENLQRGYRELTQGSQNKYGGNVAK